MQQQKTFLIVGLIIAAAVSAAGCQRTSKRYAFPSQWPTGLDLPATAGEKMVPSTATIGLPAVTVRPLAIDVEAQARPQLSGNSSVSTSHMLTQLMEEKLRQAGVRVSDTDAEFEFSGTIPKLGYTERSGYPRKLYYTSELVYQLTHRPSGSVVWEGNLSQDFEQSVLVNTMTKLPEDPNAPERILLEKCIGPNWGLIAADVKNFLEEQSSTQPAN